MNIPALSNKSLSALLKVGEIAVFVCKEFFVLIINAIPTTDEMRKQAELEAEEYTRRANLFDDNW